MVNDPKKPNIRIIQEKNAPKFDNRLNKSAPKSIELLGTHIENRRSEAYEYCSYPPASITVGMNHREIENIKTINALIILFRFLFI